MPANDPDKLVPVFHSPNEFEAQLKAVRLREHGVEAVVFAGEQMWTGGIAINPTNRGIAVCVRNADLEEAQRVLEIASESSPDADDGGSIATEQHTPLPARLAIVVIAIILIASLIAAVIVIAT